MKKLLFFFGVGTLFDQCYDQIVNFLGKKPDYLLDNDINKHGVFFKNIRCVHPDILFNYPGSEIIITTSNYISIYNQLKNMDQKYIKFCKFIRSSWSLVDISYNIISYNYNVNNNLHYNILLTGATRGLGFSLAKKLASLGHNLFLHGQNLKNLYQIKKYCDDNNFIANFLTSNFNNKNSLNIFLKKISGIKFDIIINNAAYSPNIIKDDFTYGLISDYKKCFMINTIAPVKIIQTTIPHMISNNFGRIINIQSGINFKPDTSAYSMSKIALEKFSVDLSKHICGNLSIVSINPGQLATDMTNYVGLSPDLVVNRILLPIYMDADINGKWINALDLDDIII
jgi:short-subunit dehydrogenase